MLPHTHLLQLLSFLPLLPLLLLILPLLREQTLLLLPLRLLLYRAYDLVDRFRHLAGDPLLLSSGTPRHLRCMLQLRTLLLRRRSPRRNDLEFVCLLQAAY